MAASPAFDPSGFRIPSALQVALMGEPEKDQWPTSRRLLCLPGTASG